MVLGAGVPELGFVVCADCQIVTGNTASVAAECCHGQLLEFSGREILQCDKFSHANPSGLIHGKSVTMTSPSHHVSDNGDLFQTLTITTQWEIPLQQRALQVLVE